MPKYALRKPPLTVVIGSSLAGGPVQGATIMADTTADAIGVNCSLRAAIVNANNPAISAPSNSRARCCSGIASNRKAERMTLAPHSGGSAIVPA